MKRSSALKILNLILLVLFVNQAVTVLLREHLSVETFGALHKIGGAILLCLIAVHIILNFNWFRANYFSK